MTEPTEMELKRSAMTVGGAFAIGGLSLTVAANAIQAELMVLFALFFVGVSLTVVGLVVAVWGADLGKAYVARKRAILDEAKVLSEDKGGIVWVWVVALATWAIMAMAYFALSSVVYLVLDSVEAFYPWGSDDLGVLTLTRSVMGWFLIIMTVGIIGWALINSARREDQTYPSF